VWVQCLSYHAHPDFDDVAMLQVRTLQATLRIPVLRMMGGLIALEISFIRGVGWKRLWR
jgi:hypothetical protein